MKRPGSPRLPVHQDRRGWLLPVEFDELDLDVRRAFVVTGTPQGCTRGAHFVPCEQLLILLAGAAVVRLSGGPDAMPVEESRLDVVGGTQRLPKGRYVEYDLDGGPSMLLVLADQPYVAPSDTGGG